MHAAIQRHQQKRISRKQSNPNWPKGKCVSILRKQKMSSKTRVDSFSFSLNVDQEALHALEELGLLKIVKTTEEGEFRKTRDGGHKTPNE